MKTSYASMSWGDTNGDVFSEQPYNTDGQLQITFFGCASTLTVWLTDEQVDAIVAARDRARATTPDSAVAVG